MDGNRYDDFFAFHVFNNDSYGIFYQNKFGFSVQNVQEIQKKEIFGADFKNDQRVLFDCKILKNQIEASLLFSSYGKVVLLKPEIIDVSDIWFSDNQYLF